MRYLLLLLGLMIGCSEVDNRSEFARTLDQANDSPYRITFTVGEDMGVISIAAEDVRVVGRSGKQYEGLFNVCLPEIYAVAGGAEQRLGRFEYG